MYILLTRSLSLSVSLSNVESDITYAQPKPRSLSSAILLPRRFLLCAPFASRCNLFFRKFAAVPLDIRIQRARSNDC